MNEKSTEPFERLKEPVAGVVTARKCECCGHHEIGMTDEAGRYIALRPGMRIMLVGGGID